ncbi:longitudinals lacking protein, isoforms N/O/W/X/Y isoform X5 [Drosophila tropicalis]|uniref:longitudinals lacking protein, isoforms N/O/W/X/Y isoform X5 n=1 Tax=Drosophila tropicalis TaxID=46794 RepID=UPI0035ABF959
MDDDQQFCLRWNNHQSTLISVFDTLLENETLVDCTLAAEGKFLKAHKVVLSACSPYFATLLQEQYDKHPIFILKDVKYQELRAMMDYMYRGEVNISQDQLAALLKAAESLQIKGLSDNRTGGSSAASQPKPEATQQHHRGGKLSGAYTLEQTKRARLATAGAGAGLDASADISGSREGSSSPSRRRRKVRRRSMENDAHDNSNSSVLQQAAASNQSLLQQTSAGLAVSALVSTQLASTNASPAAAAANQPLTSTNLTKKTESAKLTSTATAAVGGATAATTETSDAINTENVQQGGAQGVNVEDHESDAAASTGASHTGVVVKQLANVIESSNKSSSASSAAANHKQNKNKNDNSVSSVGSEMVIEPKAEYDDDAHDENVEDLTMDEDDMTMEELDQTAGTSQGGEGSSQNYGAWQHDRSQDDIGLMAAQDAQQRDPQDGYWTILETVPYSIASTVGQNATLTSSSQTLSNGLTAATVVVELPPDDLGNPVGNIQYTIPALTKNATTNTTTTSLLHKPTQGQATTIQIVKQHHHHQHQHQQQQQQQRSQQVTPPTAAVAPARQEFIKIDTSRLEDKMLLRDVMQYGTSISMATSTGNNSNETVVESELLLTDADEAERELELAAMGKSEDHHHHTHHPHHDDLLDDDDYMDKQMHHHHHNHHNHHQQQQQHHLHDEQQVEGDNQMQMEKLYVDLHTATGTNSNPTATGTTMTLQQVTGNDFTLDEAKFACNVCGKTYKIKGSLKRHKNYECGVEPTLKCPHCPHKCKYKSDLRKHMNQKHAESGESLTIIHMGNGN